MFRVIALAFTLFLSGSAYGKTCSSDYDCGMGNSCLKQMYQSTGVCAQRVNEYGNRDFGSGPNPGSFGPKMNDSGMCSFTTDCPIGFTCRKSSGSLKGHCIK
jgi:hypothetical protein